MTIFIKKHLKDGTLDKELDYKISDENINETINKVKTSDHGIFYIPARLINDNETSIFIRRNSAKFIFYKPSLIF